MHNIFPQRSAPYLNDLTSPSAPKILSDVNCGHQQPDPPLSARQEPSSVDVLLNPWSRCLEQSALLFKLVSSYAAFRRVHRLLTFVMHSRSVILFLGTTTLVLYFIVLYPSGHW